LVPRSRVGAAGRHLLLTLALLAAQSSCAFSSAPVRVGLDAGGGERLRAPLRLPLCALAGLALEPLELGQAAVGDELGVADGRLRAGVAAVGELEQAAVGAGRVDLLVQREAGPVAVLGGSASQRLRIS
jgi:hypothetical protein